MVENIYTYTLASTAWEPRVWKYEDYIVDELNINTDQGEFMIVWRDLKDNKPPHPQIKAFDDSWQALAFVLPNLRGFHGNDPTPDEIIRALEDMGFVPSEYHDQLNENPSISTLRHRALGGDEEAIYALAARAK